ADSQKDNHTLWWFINLIIHGNLILFIPAFLIWYCNAPVFVLAITVLAFFGNLVVNMSGAPIRVSLSTFFGSLLINLIMVLIYIL
ncbi:MAG TPA: hypothetical protein VKB19_16025, partial [Pedobacter sp.]|nr:hypothetical protein [Pedobacter sp.]